MTSLQIDSPCRHRRVDESIAASSSHAATRKLARRALRVVFLAALTLGAFAPASAQVLPFVGATELYDFVPVRDWAVVEAELKAARQGESTADLDSTEARAALELERGLVAIQKQELDVVKARIDQAKKEKNDAQRAEFQAQKKAQELWLELLERRVELREQERDFAEARKEAAHAEGTAAERELQLIQQREQLATLKAKAEGATAFELERQEQRARDAQYEALKAVREAASRRAEADKERGSLVESQIKVFKAQSAVRAGAE